MCCPAVRTTPTTPPATVCVPTPPLTTTGGDARQSEAVSGQQTSLARCLSGQLPEQLRAALLTGGEAEGRRRGPGPVLGGWERVCAC